MSTPVNPPRPLARQPAAGLPPKQIPGAVRPVLAGEPPNLDQVVNDGGAATDRTILYARPGWGKTSMAAQIPGVIFLLTEGEDGLKTLIRSRQIGLTPHFPHPARTYGDVLAAVDQLIVKDHSFRAFAIDSLSGVQELLFREASKEFNSWKEATAFGGYHLEKVAAPRLTELLDRLDRLRQLKGMPIWLLCHAESARMPNAEGLDYLAWRPILGPKYIWPTVSAWADMVLFGHQEVFVKASDKQQQKPGKASVGTRLLLTASQAWYEAKNRHGLPDQIDCGASAQEAYANFKAALESGS